MPLTIPLDSIHQPLVVGGGGAVVILHHSIPPAGVLHLNLSDSRYSRLLLLLLLLLLRLLLLLLLRLLRLLPLRLLLLRLLRLLVLRPAAALAQAEHLADLREPGNREAGAQARQLLLGGRGCG